MEARPEVVSASVEADLFLRPQGTEYFPGYTLLARAPWPGRGSDADVAGARQNDPVITAGRAASASATDEVVISERLAADLDVGVGDTVTVETMTEGWVLAAYSGENPGPPDGPVVELSVVGLGKTTADFGRWQGLMHLSAGFVERYVDEMEISARVEMELTPESAAQALAGRHPDLEALQLDPGFSPFFDQEASSEALSTIATAMRLVAAAAAAAGAAAITIAIARIVGTGIRDRSILATLGWTRRRQVNAMVLALAPSLAVGVISGLLVGLVASPDAMAGLASRMDPTPDDVILHLPTLLAITLVTVAGLTVASGVCIRLAMARHGERPVARRRGLQLQPPLPVTLGVRHALFGRVERGGRASRGCTPRRRRCRGRCRRSARHRVVDPPLGGRPRSHRTRCRAPDRQRRGDDTAGARRERLADDRRVELLVKVDVSLDLALEGNENPVLIYEVRRGRFEPALTSGRLARQPDEILLGPATAESLDVGLGDELALSGPGGTERFELVGTMLFPEGDFDHDRGVAMPRVAADRVVGDFAESTAIHSVVFEWADGVDAAAADAEVQAAGLPVQPDATEAVPGVVTKLLEVGSLPAWFAVFIGALASVSLGHALAVALRLRRSELSTLRALGMTGPSGALVFAMHAATIAGAALVIGTPIGLALGAQLWRLIATRAHVVVTVWWPWEELRVIALVAFLVLLVMSAVTAWRAIRMRPAEHLRTN